MASEIIYVCNSTNNKNIRQGELNILEKHENQLYFEFGSDEMNVKKRFYNDIETLNKDFNALMKLKKNKQINEQFEEVADGEFRSVPVFEEPKKEIKKDKEQKEEKTDKYKIIKRKK
jgi:hypothetical protein